MKRMGKGCLILIGIIVVLGIVGAALGGNGTPTAPAQPAVVADVQPTVAPVAAEPTQAPVATEAPAAAAVLNVGETGDLDGIKVTLNEVKVVPGNEVFKPEDGKQFIVVDATFENAGTKDATISSMLQMELRDDTGQAYSIDIGATTASGGKAPDGAVLPGDKLRGQIGYQVPTNATGLTWRFKDAFGTGRVQFNAQP